MLSRKLLLGLSIRRPQKLRLTSSCVLTHSCVFYYFRKVAISTRVLAAFRVGFCYFACSPYYYQ
jgi:hypothetical protein